MSHLQESEQLRRLQAIIEGTRAGTWEWNAHTGEQLINERWAEMLGYSARELEPISIALWHRLCHPDDLARSNEVFQKHFEGELPYYECVVRLRHKAGHWVWVHDRGRLISRTAEGAPEWVVGTHIDISEQHINAQLLSKLAQTVPGVIYSFRMYADGHIEVPYISEGARQFYGHEPESIRRDPNRVFERVHPDDLQMLHSSILESFETQNQWACEYRVLVDGEEVWLESLATPERDWEGQEVVTWYGVVVDITHRKRLEERLLELSVTDELTGLYNRRFLVQRLSELLEDYRRHGVIFSLIQIDLDWFKSVNDTHGHLMGDEVLKAFAATLKNRLRHSDIAGRSGGEEFLILLPHTRGPEARDVIESIRSAFATTEFFGDGLEVFKTSFSAGVTEVFDSDGRFDQLLSRADAALYKAKEWGRNRVHLVMENEASNDAAGVI
ncbi:sensor domain-containing diguanylate cyclase [Marinimicrobium locisalis]|uniref:sensor domain-containing diguanylate cyclase n=1 Tax=Marinimicrobium locisalis TaxID=546022 RepID=UPI003221D16A